MTDRNFRMGKGVFAHHDKKAAAVVARDSCSSGGFYTAPTANQVVDVSAPVNLTWDSACLTSSYVDIYLYEPAAATPNIYVWEKVWNAYGSYEATFQPGWWNSSSSARLYLSILPSGTQPFQSALPAGPVFNVTVPASAVFGDLSGSGSTATFQTVDNNPNKPAAHSGPSKGGIAAAVLIPLLAIAGLVIFFWLRIKRGVEKAKRRRFSAAVDQRMSAINPDWAAITPAGAAAAVRASVALDRPVSSFGAGGLRPMSEAVGGGQAGIGARGLGGVGLGGAHPEMAESYNNTGIRTVGTGLRNDPAVTARALSERVSRVSFAPDQRPSMDSRKSVASRAFHTGFTVVPPVPTRNDSNTLSPTQAAGALPLSPDDIRARVGALDEPRPSMDENMLPALRLMRAQDEELVTPFGARVAPPAVPPPASPGPSASSMSSFMPMAAASMSPDDMLRAYAGRRVASPPPGQAAVGMPVPAYTGTPVTAASFESRKSAAPTEGSRYSEYGAESAYGGTL